MKALILAAGEGTRLRPLTNDLPKAMVPVNGRPLLLRQYEVLLANKISDINIVGGFCSEVLPDDRMKVFHNPDFAVTNMVYSMFQAGEVFTAGEEILIIYGDILFGDGAVNVLRNTPGDIVVGVNTQWRKLWEARFEDPLSDAESMILNDARILELGKKVQSMDEIQGQFTGLIKFSAKAAREIWAGWGKQALNNPSGSPVSTLYMTDFLQGLIDDGYPVAAAFVEGDWLEVDSVEDLQLYEEKIRTASLSTITTLDLRVVSG